MKKKTTFVLMMLMVSMTFAARLGTLEGVFKPQLIKVFEDDVFVVEGHKLFVYSLKDLRLKRKIGKEGEGPGEFNLDPNRTAAVSVFPESLIIESRFKVVYFSRDGKFIKEIRKHPGTVQTVPIGKNFVVHKILYGPGGKSYFTLNLYDSEMKEIKELYRVKFFNFEGKLHLMADSINFCICDNKLFIEESTDGFVIEVFDSEGNKLNRIEKPYKKIKVTENLREEALDHFLSIPALRQAVKEKGKIEVVNDLERRGGLIYTDYLPAIQDIKTDGKSIFLKTCHKKGDKEKYFLMDVKGKTLKEIYLPMTRKESFFNQLQGDKKYYSFYNHKFYYLKNVETEDDENWEVHVEDIK
jgi:hypothetical protein